MHMREDSVQDQEKLGLRISPVVANENRPQHSIWRVVPGLTYIMGWRQVSETANFRLPIGALAEKDSDVTYSLSRKDQ